MRINNRYITPPIDNTTLIFVLSIFGLIFLTVNIVFWRNWLTLLLSAGIYLVVIIIAVTTNNYLKKISKTR